MVAKARDASLREIRHFLGHRTYEKSPHKALSMNESVKTEL